MSIIELINILSIISGIISVWLTSRQHIVWIPAGVINVLTTAFICYHTQLYSDFVLQWIYLVLILYALYKWNAIQVIEQSAYHTYSISLIQGTIYLSLVVIFGFLLGYIMKKIFHASMPYTDAILMMLCLVAQYLQSKKIIQHYLLWIIANIGYIYLYIARAETLLHWQHLLWSQAGLYLLYLLIAIYGWYKWNRHKKKIV